METRALAGADAITLPSGTHTLRVEGFGEDQSVEGDLDVTDDLTPNGEGATTTLI